MNPPLARIICITTILSATFIHSFAQNKPVDNTLKPPPVGIVVDGDLKDWGDSLRYLNAENHIDYSLANDKDNLYMAIRINDYTEQIMILNAGLTLPALIPTAAKKKRFSVTFPVGEQGGVNTGFPAYPKKVTLIR